MEFCILSIVLVLILFACSITNFVKQLPKCRKDTRKAIDRTIVPMGYFINFERNAKILSNLINELTPLIQESDGSQLNQSWLQYMVAIQKEALQVSDEAGGIINSYWHKRRWSRSCYQLSNRVAEMISMIQLLLPLPRCSRHYKGDAIPGIVVVVLIVFALTNTAFHIESSTTANPYVIDWIVLEMLYPFKFNNNLKKLRDRIVALNKRRSWFQQNPGQELLQIRVGYNANLLDEAEQLSEEVGNLVDYWYKGWTGSRFRFNKRTEEVLKGLKPRTPLKGGGSNSRKIIDYIDQTSQILPAAITDIRRYLYLETHIEVLKVLIINPLRHWKFSAADAQILANELKLMEVTKNEAMQLIQQAECIDQHWYKMWCGIRYRLSKRVAKITIQIMELQRDIESKLIGLHRPYQNLLSQQT